jgi:hypothetical protein
MQVMLVSSSDIARAQADALQVRGVEIIATGLNQNGQQQIALIDVTPEVRSKQLDPRNLKLVNAFLHRNQQEILAQVRTLSTVPQVMAAGAD